VGQPEVVGFPDRRRLRAEPRSAMQWLEAMPSVVLLRRLATPLIAVDDGGEIVDANDAFAKMVGLPRAVLTKTPLRMLLKSVPLGKDGVVAALRAHADSVVQLVHADGWSLSAVMSGSTLLRHDDPIAVMTFTDISEHLWGGGRVKPASDR
jgi:PAS domain-containing protein